MCTLAARAGVFCRRVVQDRFGGTNFFFFFCEVAVVLLASGAMEEVPSRSLWAAERNQKEWTGEEAKSAASVGERASAAKIKASSRCHKWASMSGG